MIPRGPYPQPTSNTFFSSWSRTDSINNLEPKSKPCFENTPWSVKNEKDFSLILIRTSFSFDFKVSFSLVY